MNKPLKITLISLGSLLGLILITILIVCWLVLTPARLTSIVQKQAPNFITCDFKIGQAELTVVRSFPYVGVEINDLLLLNDLNDSHSDTLAYINKCVVSVDVKKFLKENHIIIDECGLSNAYFNLFTDNYGNTNIDIFPPSEPDTTESNSDFNYGIDLVSLKLNNVSADYTDLTQGLSANINGLNMSAKGNMKGDDIAGNVKANMANIAYKQTTDSLSMSVKLNELNVEGDAEMSGNDIKADIAVSSSLFSYESDGQYAETNSLNMKYKGDIINYDNVKGYAELTLAGLSFVMDDEKFVNQADIRMLAPFDITLSKMDVELGTSQIALNNILIDLMGKVEMPSDDIVLDLDVKTNTMIVEELIELIPDSMRDELLDGIDVKGELQLTANVKGVYNGEYMPVVNAELSYNKGVIDMPELLPYPVTNFNTSLKADIDLNNKTDVYVDYLNANMSKSSLALSGTIKDVMDKMYCNIKLNANANLNELRSFLPEDIVAEGNIKMNANAIVNNYQITNMDFMKSKINGDIQWDNMNVVYCDTINVNADRLLVDFTLPNPVSENIDNSLAAIKVEGTNLDAKMSDMIVANLKGYNIDAHISNILDENMPMSVYADYYFERIDASLDDMTFFTDKPKGSVAMFMKEGGDDASYIAVYDGDSLSFKMGEEMSFVTEKLNFNVSADYDDDQEDLLLQWNPHAGIKLDNAVFDMEDLPMTLYIPSVDFQYDTTGININNSSVVLGNSDFELKGKLTDIDKFLRKEALLKGKLDFTSHYTDVNQIMEMFNGMGDTTAVEVETATEEIAATTDTAVNESGPFMVPLGIDVTLNTKIEKAIAGNMNLNNLGGSLTVKDGILVLQEMGFTSDAATMEVTAMYKSPRKNHLFLGMDLHLLEIDIAEMIDLMPELDTLVPMLSSFAGRAEFHFAFQTNLNSNYELKMSTLKGITSIRGNDLVVLDNDTYRKIGRILGFKDKKHNRIDSLAVEISAYKNEIDVLPTLITIDKYQAVIAGRHKLDMTFDYRFGLTNPWYIRRIGLTVKGDLDNMKFRLRAKKNLGLENPKGKKEDVHLAEEALRLKNLIYESIK